jgi:ABC-type dipeptide/oligopeptide/nickel transport system ATPase component
MTEIPGASDGPIVRTAALRKTYASPRGKVPAVRGLDLQVSDGEFFGLLGPNGACGRSAGCRSPSSPTSWSTSAKACGPP